MIDGRFKDALYMLRILMAVENEFNITIQDSEVEFINTFEDLIKLIQGLAPGFRMVFNLFAIEGYSHQEIAQQLGISEGTSKSQLARARIILQERLKKLETLSHEPIR